MSVGTINPLIKTITATNSITTLNSEYTEVAWFDQVAANIVIDVNTPGAVTAASATDINTSTEVITVASSGTHDFTTGLKVQVTTSSALPTGISAVTDYFVISLSSTTFQLASSLVNAQAGTPINITAVGTGTQTFTPVALAGATIKVQYSNNVSDTNSWVDGPALNAAYAAALGGSAQAITADSAFFFRMSGGEARYIRFVSTLTAGRFSYNIYLIGH